MDKAAQERLDKVLKSPVPTKLRNLDVQEFTTTLVKLYAELDYIHPFSDVNSRTLRTFTRQLAKESGYELDWTRFNASEVGRDLLYIARERSVNLLAKPHIQHEQSMRKIVHSMDRLEGNKDLAGLLQDVVRPNRAVAFEKLPEDEALQQHPELATAYRTLQEASVYFTTKLPESREVLQQAIKSVAKHIQEYLNQGEYRNFGAARDAAKAERSVEPPSVQAPEKSPGRGR